MVSALFDRVVPSRTRQGNARSEHGSWREVGWIFRDGETLAIERRGYETRVRDALA